MLGIFPSIWRRWPYPPQIRKKKKITFFLVVVVSAPHCADAMRRGGGALLIVLYTVCVCTSHLWLLIPPAEEKVSRRPQHQQQKRATKVFRLFLPIFFRVKSKKFFQCTKRKRRGPRSVWVGAIALHAIETRSCHRRQHNNLFNNFIHAKLYKRLVVFLPVAKRFAPSRSQKKNSRQLQEPKGRRKKVSIFFYEATLSE